MREAEIEAYLYRQCVKRGWLCEKFTSPNRRSVPDRIITAPGPLIFFVECKAPGKTVTELQLRDHVRRMKLGCEVRVADSKQAVDAIIKEIANGKLRTDEKHD